MITPIDFDTALAEVQASRKLTDEQLAEYRAAALRMARETRWSPAESLSRILEAMDRPNLENAEQLYSPNRAARRAAARRK